MVVTAPSVALTRVVGRLARDNTMRNPRRTATTAISLMIGLALVSAFSVLAASTKASDDELVDSEIDDQTMRLATESLEASAPRP